MYRESTAEESIIVSRWKPTAVERPRLYLNGWEKLIGLRYETFKSGFVRWATLNGEAISNTAANRLIGMKLWLDEAHTLHIDRMHCKSVMPEHEVRPIIEASLEERGIYIA